MKIKKLENSEIETVVNLWYNISIEAHDFIPKQYWEKNKKDMAEIYLPHSETYIVIIDNKIVAFISMLENILAAIFVDTQEQGKGVGKELLNYVKEKRNTIQLNVYKQNQRSINFYKKQGFQVISENIDENTNETELLMEWKKN